MTQQPRHTYLLEVFENLGTPLLTAVAEATERDRLIALQQGQAPRDPDETEEAERIAELLKATAELGLSLSRQIDLRMVDDAAADGVRLTLATLSAPLIANVYRVGGRTPNTVDIERIVGAMQAVTLFSDNYNAAADATARMQTLDAPFAPADAPQIQLMILNALMPAVNAVATFSFGQPEKNLIGDVMARLTDTAKGLRALLFANAPERDALRAEIKLLSTVANLYSQAHFTEMSKLMFLDETQRDQVDLGARLADLWRVVDARLAMVRVVAETLVMGQNTTSSGAAAPFQPVQQSQAPTTGGNSPFSGFTKPAEPMAPVPQAAQTVAPVSSAPASAGGSPFSAFVKPKDTAAGGAA
jgi:hypothetical protein